MANILTAAKKEFLEKGYQKASLRNIVKQAGVTTGAFYGYFKNKEELFDALAGEHYRAAMALYQEILGSFHQLSPEEQAGSMEDYSELGMRRMADYMYANYDAFKLILCCSDGTPYNGLVHELAQMDVEATHDFAEVTRQEGMPLNPINPTLEHMLTSGMFATFFELIVHDIPREEAETYIHQMLSFYSGGWQRILGY